MSQGSIMASRWSSEYNVSEHRDLQANTMALDREGCNVLLGGKRHIAIKNLNCVSDPLKKFPRQSKYEIKAAEWNMTSLNSHYCAVAANQKIEVYFYHDGQLEYMHCLKHHTRLVSDLNWHRFEPNLLATASVDTFTYVWDLRDVRKPAATFSAIASSNHVRWNKLTSYLIATAHEGDIRIWDQRKGTAPIQYISAHFSKIHDVDWSQTHEYQLATCSQDATVKFFDVTNPKCIESAIQTTGPVWKARYTPFGEGLVTVVVPHVRRIENSLLLWNLSNQSMPVYTFVGHTDVVLEFEWRKRMDTSEYQLVTWSKDQSLRTWRIEPFLQKLCGYDLDSDSQGYGEDIGSDFVNINTNDLTNSSSKYVALEDSIIPGIEAMNVESLTGPEYCQLSEKNSIQDSFKCLRMEFASLSGNDNLKNIKFDEMNASRRSCMITVNLDAYVVKLHVTFPLAYPCNAAPSFQIQDSSTIDGVIKTKLLKVLKQTAQQRVIKNKTCLESCLIQFLGTLENSVQLLEAESKKCSRSQPANGMEAALSHNSYLYGAVHDVHIPYPKTCGARFCSVDLLVCFHRSSWPRKLTAKAEASTPRSLSSKSEINLLNYPGIYMIRSGTHDAPNQSLRYFIQSKGLNKNGTFHSENIQNNSKPQSTFAKTVSIYDCSKLFFIHRELGEKYVFDSRDIIEMCKKNAEVAGSVGRQDLVQTWTLASLVATLVSHKVDAKDVMLWSEHPFSTSLIDYLILHYAKMSDVQTAAMLCWTFSCKNEARGYYFNKVLNTKFATPTAGGSPYHTIHPAEVNSENWNVNSIKQKRSNSLSGSLDELKYMCHLFNPNETDSLGKLMIEEASKEKANGDELMKKYADILHRWNLLENRVQITKLLRGVVPDCFRFIEFSGDCAQCKKRLNTSAYCPNCKRFLLKCALCRILVRGSSIFCLVCGHGGHSRHMLDWFSVQLDCPTGCGCKCLLEMSNLWDY